VSAPPATPTPAEWKSYDLLLDFRALPRTYSTRGGEARSPRVEVKFQLPEPLSGAATRYAEITVSERTVRLAPGAPGSLQAGDCELMRQMQETLLAGLPVHVTSSAFHCSAATESFALTIDAPLPAHEGATPRS
jgi:hypothetical protein